MSDVTISVRRESGCWLDGNLEDAIDLLKDALKEIPQEYRDSARIEFEHSGGGDYYGCEIEFTVSYRRPETPAEAATRIAREHERRASHEAQERAVYEQLRRKYG